MIRILLVCLALGAFYPVASRSEDPTRLDVETLIANVISGIDYSGQDIILSGIALSTSDPDRKLIHIGTQQAYQAGDQGHAVAVRDVVVDITKGTAVTVKIHVEASYAAKMGEETFVMIEGSLLECVSCEH